MEKGKLFVIDSGSDGSGKKTQTELLYSRLVSEGYKVQKVDYPNYGSNSSALVKMYLNGEFGSQADAVNPYTASTFYSVDRCASFMTGWKQFYEEGGIVLADRYTTSNMIHQAPKIEDPAERQVFLDWLYDLEFIKCQLPIPEKVFFLDVPVEVTTKLMENRKNKIDNGDKKDIHESDVDYLKKCYSTSCDIADQFGWLRVACTNKGEMRSIDSIHEEIYAKIVPLLS